MDLELVLQRALQDAAYAVKEIRPMPAGESNTLFAVTLGDASLLVARIPTCRRSQFQMERFVMEAARNAGIPVPEVLDLLDEPNPRIMLMTSRGALDGWPRIYPKSELAADIEMMVEAITTSLISNYGEAITGLWLKGSAAKPWDSPIDYVPEISDVDIHYRPRDGQGSELSDLDAAVRVHADIAQQFEKTRPRALHTPRPQLVSLPQVEQLADYIPSPPSTVRTLFGEAPSKVHIDPKAVRTADSRNLIEGGDPLVLEKAIDDLVERPGHYLFTGLRNLNWRLSPVASRALSVLGVTYDVAWSVNRTQAVELLRENGQDELATYYSSYYLAAWEFFLSEWRDGDAGRSAFSDAVRALRLGAELGRSRLGRDFDPIL